MRKAESMTMTTFTIYLDDKYDAYYTEEPQDTMPDNYTFVAQIESTEDVADLLVDMANKTIQALLNKPRSNYEN